MAIICFEVQPAQEGKMIGRLFSFSQKAWGRSFAAVALKVYEKARENGLGQDFPTSGFFRMSEHEVGTDENDPVESMEINSAAAAKSADIPLGLSLLNQTLVVSAREQSENLTEHGSSFRMQLRNS
jgi:hypothetical protein